MDAFSFITARVYSTLSFTLTATKPLPPVLIAVSMDEALALVEQLVPYEEYAFQSYLMSDERLTFQATEDPFMPAVRPTDRW